MCNDKGVIHLLPLIFLALLCLIVLTVKNNSGVSNPGDRVAAESLPADKNSSEFIRQTAYSMIDAYSKLMKLKVDAALYAWDSISPEQKQQLREYISNTMKSGMDKGSVMVDEISKRSTDRNYQIPMAVLKDKYADH